MKITQTFLCSQEEFDTYKSRDKVPLQCVQCACKYTRTKKNILDKFKVQNTTPKFCSNTCKGLHRTESATTIHTCLNCGNSIKKRNWELKKSTKTFCNSSCSASYNNKHKQFGTRRSKLEKYLEKQLTVLYPELQILYSNKEVIGSELDVYIPSLKLAFEIQGIFHFKPIFGQAKLDQIQANDLAKIEECKKLGIRLIHIDTQTHSYVTPKTCEKFLNLIVAYIDNRP